MGTLTDTGPLVALVDRAQQHHARCVAVLPGILMPLITTWPCLTEAMYLLGKASGWFGQERLWSLVTTGRLQVHTEPESHMAGMRILMERYRDVPMDFADASLVAAAESLNTRRIFTLDGDFYVYRAKDMEAFEVVPAR
jgi:uncharacterized protein